MRLIYLNYFIVLINKGVGLACLWLCRLRGGTGRQGRSGTSPVYPGLVTKDRGWYSGVRGITCVRRSRVVTVNLSIIVLKLLFLKQVSLLYSYIIVV